MSVVLQVIREDRGDQVDLKDQKYPEGQKERAWIHNCCVTTEEALFIPDATVLTIMRDINTGYYILPVLNLKKDHKDDDYQ